MELFDSTGITTFEQYLIYKSRTLHIPVGGTLELLPLCNLNCQMCYIRMDKNEMDASGKILSAEQWIPILQDAKHAGVLFLLLTGGEPLLYPEFSNLYQKIQSMGFITTINTNGTLIDDKWIDLFRTYPCRRLNITLYGPDEKTYGELCGNSQAFLRVMKAAEMLKENQIPFRFNASVTPQNIEKIEQMKSIAQNLGVSIHFNSYMFPPYNPRIEFNRISPEASARIMMKIRETSNSNNAKAELARKELSILKEPIHSHAAGYGCSVGRNGFWMNWKGELQCCGMIPTPSISLLDHPLRECFDAIVKESQAFQICQECEKCSMRNLCHVCYASCYTETGDLYGKPEYLCIETKAKIMMLLNELPEEEQLEYRKLLETNFQE